jgi:CheY-like chemotaxis protein
VVADADHMPSVQLVVATERLPQTVFIGTQPPLACSAWMARPIDPLHVLRELDAMVALAAREGAVPTQGTAVRLGAELRGELAPAADPAAPVATAPIAPRALLVDDSEIALRYLESRLQRWGVQTERATTSHRALERLSQRAFDCVFLDIELGEASELDGLALCQVIKRGPHAPGGAVPAVFMVSAHHTELDRVRGALAGCDAFLGKPLEEIELRRLLLRQGYKPPREPGPDAGLPPVQPRSPGYSGSGASSHQR